MFYSDEIRRIAPIFWMMLVCLVGWAAAFWAWPFWTGVVVAIAFGILGSYLFGSWLREKVRNKISEHDARTRAAIQANLDELGGDDGGT